MYPSADRIALARGASTFMDFTDPSGTLDSVNVVGRSAPRLRSMMLLLGWLPHSADGGVSQYLPIKQGYILLPLRSGRKKPAHGKGRWSVGPSVLGWRVHVGTIILFCPPIILR